MFDKALIALIAVIPLVYGFLMGMKHQASRQEASRQTVIIIKDCEPIGAKSFKCNTREEL